MAPQKTAPARGQLRPPNRNSRGRGLVPFRVSLALDRSAGESKLLALELFPTQCNLGKPRTYLLYWGIAISSSSAAPPSIIQLGGVVRLSGRFRNGGVNLNLLSCHPRGIVIQQIRRLRRAYPYHCFWPVGISRALGIAPKVSHAALLFNAERANLYATDLSSR
jgi:hypothetical protein